MLAERRRERVVCEGPPARRRAIHERELVDPEGVVRRRIGEPERLAEVLAHHPECLARDPVRVRHREHEVAVLRLGRAPETGELGRGKELRDLRADLLAGQRELREPLGTLALREGGPVVDLLSCRLRLARDDHSAHRAAVREWLA